MVAHLDNLWVKLEHQGHRVKVTCNDYPDCWTPNSFVVTNLWYWYTHQDQGRLKVKASSRSRSFQNVSVWIFFPKVGGWLSTECILVN